MVHKKCTKCKMIDILSSTDKSGTAKQFPNFSTSTCNCSISTITIAIVALVQSELQSWKWPWHKLQVATSGTHCQTHSPLCCICIATVSVFALVLIVYALQLYLHCNCICAVFVFALVLIVLALLHIYRGALLIWGWQVLEPRVWHRRYTVVYTYNDNTHVYDTGETLLCIQWQYMCMTLRKHTHTRLLRVPRYIIAWSPRPPRSHRGVKDFIVQTPRTAITLP